MTNKQKTDAYDALEYLGQNVWCCATVPSQFNGRGFNIYPMYVCSVKVEQIGKTIDQKQNYWITMGCKFYPNKPGVKEKYIIMNVPHVSVFLSQADAIIEYNKCIDKQKITEKDI